MSSGIVLAVHGGAGRLDARKLRGPGRRAYQAGLARALEQGRRVLLRGGGARRAAVAAVVSLEDDPLFNAGHGAVLCADGSVELSASVMDGRTLAVGAVVGARRTRNPVLAASALLRHRHGLLFGKAADEFAGDADLPLMSRDYFVTPHRLAQWRQYRGTGRVALDHGDEEALHGTVGAVARDRRGHMAAATSTGGLVNQLPGRVGDSPVVGAGTWASAVCAVSATGRGDAFARVAFARRVADLVELAGMSLEEAGTSALEEIRRVRGRGGCIVVDAAGRVAFPFNSRHMLRGWVADRGRPVVAIRPGESIEVRGAER